IHAAQRMGLRCLSLDPGSATPAGEVAESILGRLDDPDAVAEILRSCRRTTLENEFIPAAAIREACRRAGVQESVLTPGIDCLATIQDKLSQRTAYARHGAPSPRAVPMEEAEPSIGYPMMLKARFGGYDGKGTRSARTRDELESHRPLWSEGGWMAEEFVPFRRELAVMVARSPQEVRCFPTMETIQTNHVCDLVFPAGVDASAAAVQAVEAVGGFGLCGVELFELEDGRFLINEIAPRPHNTGHYTLDWGGPSQFEVHVRLAMGLPLPALEGGEACMANLLGVESDRDWRFGLEAALREEPDVHVHWYGKAQMKAGRKMGHINAVGPDARERAVRARAAFFEALR
ncbi:MAG: ATP-grasp domain-containing protein, partial [Fimbriimonadaceae bacterium]|nr:ATP-grasp domain-containing protein [Fimbriimonadaceae bacterium]